VSLSVPIISPNGLKRSYGDLIAADDGSDHKTRDLIDRMRKKVSYEIIHVWQEDNGFQKCKILNKAIQASHNDYLIMTDGDCIPREDFVQVHYINKHPGYFISGGYYMLPMNISKAITLEDIEKQNCFNIQWLKEKGIPKTFKNTKLTAQQTRAGMAIILRAGKRIS